MAKKVIILSRVSTDTQTLGSQTDKVMSEVLKYYSEDEIIIIENKESAVKKSEEELLDINNMKDVKILDNLMGRNKFDVIISNAPYDNGLHEKFEAKYFDLCKGQIVWVSPLSFLLGKKQNKKLTVHLDKYRTDIEQINGNEFFDAVINGTMGIVYVDMDIDNQGVTFDGKGYNKCSEISQYSNDSLLMEFKNIIKPLYEEDDLFSHLKYTPGLTVHGLGMKEHTENNPNLSWWVVRITRFSDRYTLYSNKSYLDTYKNLINIKNSVGKTQKKYLDYYFAFENKQGAINCINYLKTSFARAAYYIVQTGIELFMSGEFKYIPWFDFSNPIFSKSPSEIDDYLFDKFNISDEIRQHIEEILPDYYGIRKG